MVVLGAGFPGVAGAGAVLPGAGWFAGGSVVVSEVGFGVVVSVFGRRGCVLSIRGAAFSTGFSE